MAKSGHKLPVDILRRANHSGHPIPPSGAAGFLTHDPAQFEIQEHDPRIRGTSSDASRRIKFATGCDVSDGRIRYGGYGIRGKLFDG